MLYVVGGLREKIRQHRRRLQKLKDYRSRLTTELDGLPRSQGMRSRLEALTVMILDCEVTIDELESIRVECCDELCAWLIKCLPNEVQQSVMIERYVFDKKFSEISKKLGYSEQHVYRMHQAALKKLPVKNASPMRV